MRIPKKNKKIKIVLLDPNEEGKIKSNDKDDDDNEDAKPAATADEFVMLELEDVEDEMNDKDAKINDVMNNDDKSEFLRHKKVHDCSSLCTKI